MRLAAHFLALSGPCAPFPLCRSRGLLRAAIALMLMVADAAILPAALPSPESSAAAERAAVAIPATEEVPHRLPPTAPPRASAYQDGPLLVIQRDDPLYNPEYLARRVASDPEPVRLPPPTFLPPADAPDGSPVPSSPYGSQPVLPSEAFPDGGVMGLTTPPEGSRRRGFFAMVFGPGIEAGGEMLSDVRFDYRNFYSPRGLLWLGAGIGVTAIIANTKIDQHFQDWYQDNVRSSRSDQIQQDINWLGHGNVMIPVWLASGFALTPLEDYSPTAHVIGTWGRNSTRAFLVGAPMLIALQYGLGAHRPSADINSYWHPFKDSHGASGDAWIGAISFLTAAKMTDSKLAKVALWSLALFPAWGRVDVNQHYLSQVTLGVWLAALSVEAVDLTDRNTNIFIAPTAMPGGYGASIGFKW